MACDENSEFCAVGVSSQANESVITGDHSVARYKLELAH